MTKKLGDLHIAMYPWFAMGHLTSFLHLANKLAEKGQKISFFLPPKTQPMLASLNHLPHLITFIPVPVPPVPGLPHGTETTNDLPGPARGLLMIAMDLTRDTIDSHLARLKPDLVFFDFAQWVPGLARKHGIKSVHYSTSFMLAVGYFTRQARNLPVGHVYQEAELVRPPPGFPIPEIRLAAHEARAFVYILKMDFGGMTLVERSEIGYEECDAVGFKTCREMEGPFCEFAEKHMHKPVLLAGPVVPTHPGSGLREDMDRWLKGFDHGSVIYCALGSECVLEEHQFHELVLGLELTGRPFLAALKPPRNYETVESALPEGFIERTKERGMINGEWVQQPLILHHSSVGCFMTHCGAGSLMEGMMSDCQIVMLPQTADQFLNARLMSLYLKLGVEIERRENDRFFTQESVRKAVGLVMEEGSEVGREVRVHHAKWRDLMSKEGLEDSYIHQLVLGLQGLLGQHQ